MFNRLLRLLRPGDKERTWDAWRLARWSWDGGTITGTRDWLTIRTTATSLRIKRPDFFNIAHCMASAIDDKSRKKHFTDAMNGFKAERLSREQLSIARGDTNQVLPVWLATETCFWLGQASRPSLPRLKVLGELELVYDNGRLDTLRKTRSGEGIYVLHPDAAALSLSLDATRCRMLAATLWDIVAGARTSAELDFHNLALTVTAQPDNPPCIFMRGGNRVTKQSVSRAELAHLAACLECYAA